MTHFVEHFQSVFIKLYNSLSDFFRFTYDFSLLVRTISLASLTVLLRFFYVWLTPVLRYEKEREEKRNKTQIIGRTSSCFGYNQFRLLALKTLARCKT